MSYSSVFYCPLHRTKEYSSFEVETADHNYDYDLCTECAATLDKFLPVSQWFKRSNEKIPDELKRDMKTTPAEYYLRIQMYQRSLTGSGMTVITRSKFTSLRYLDSELVKVQLYESIKPGVYAMGARNQRRYREQEIKAEDLYPLQFARSDPYIRDLLKSTTHVIQN